MLAGLDAADGRRSSRPRPAPWCSRSARLLPWKKVWRNVALGLTARDVRARAEAALTEVGLGHRARRLARHPLGRRGPARRAGPGPGARARLLLLDEPFAALDALTRLRCTTWCCSLWRAPPPPCCWSPTTSTRPSPGRPGPGASATGASSVDLLVDVGHPRHRADARFNASAWISWPELGVAPDPLEDEG